MSQRIDYKREYVRDLEIRQAKLVISDCGAPNKVICSR